MKQISAVMSVKLVCWCEKVGAEELDLKMDCWMAVVAVLADQLPESPARHCFTSVCSGNKLH